MQIPSLFYFPCLLVFYLFLVSTAKSSASDNEDINSNETLIADVDSRHLTEVSSHGYLQRRRDVQLRLDTGHVPDQIRKMGVDEGEKFFPEYWGFEVDGEVAGGMMRSPKDEEESDVEKKSNLKAPLALHHQQSDVASLHEEGRRLGRAIPLLVHEVFRRGACPVGTNSCSGIGYPNSCCGTGTNCIVVADTGLGPVGCCPSGTTCSGSVSSCAAGNTACPSSIGGGCCIPGYTCSGVGCVMNVIVTITSILTIVTSSSTELVTSIITTSSTAAPSPPSSISTSLAIMTATSTSTATITAVSSTVTPGAPVRPTSESTTITSIQETTTASVASGSTCPTGFYACSAYYQGGCCRTGRDCGTVSCPAAASTTLLSNGLTIVVPLTGAATTTAIGTCANGWATCASSLGGNCCPSGWACGTASCSSTGATATIVQSKEALTFGSGAVRGMEGGQWTLMLGFIVATLQAIL